MYLLLLLLLLFHQICGLFLGCGFGPQLFGCLHQFGKCAEGSKNIWQVWTDLSSEMVVWFWYCTLCQWPDKCLLFKLMVVAFCIFWNSTSVIVCTKLYWTSSTLFHIMARNMATSKTATSKRHHHLCRLWKGCVCLLPVRKRGQGTLRIEKIKKKLYTYVSCRWEGGFFFYWMFLIKHELNTEVGVVHMCCS